MSKNNTEYTLIEIDVPPLPELERGQRVQFLASIIDKYGNKIFDSHDFEILNKDKDK